MLCFSQHIKTHRLQTNKSLILKKSHWLLQSWWRLGPSCPPADPSGSHTQSGSLGYWRPDDDKYNTCFFCSTYQYSCISKKQKKQAVWLSSTYTGFTATSFCCLKDKKRRCKTRKSKFIDWDKQRQRPTISTSPPPRMRGIDSAWMSVGSLKSSDCQLLGLQQQVTTTWTDITIPAWFSNIDVHVKQALTASPTLPQPARFQA